MTAYDGHVRSDAAKVTRQVALLTPAASDAVRVWNLIGACPPLDRNSLYCTLLQCTDFRDTCVLAASCAAAVGWLSAYTQPQSRSTLFVWQVAVHPAMRGCGLGKRMLSSLLARPTCASIQEIKATVTQSNGPSTRLFTAVARDLETTIRQDPWFDRKAHFDGMHESESLITIGPFTVRRNHHSWPYGATAQ